MRVRMFRTWSWMRLTLSIKHVGGAAEAHVAGAGVRGVGGAGGDSVPVAVRAVAEVGAAAQDAGGAFGRAGGVFAGLVGGLPGVVAGAEPVGAPFPDVAADVVQAVPVGWEGIDSA